MTNSQEVHLSRLTNDTILRMMKKYRAGAEEHGGDLQDMPLIELLENQVDEAIDQIVYSLTALDKAKELCAKQK